MCLNMLHADRLTLFSCAVLRNAWADVWIKYEINHLMWTAPSVKYERAAASSALYSTRTCVTILVNSNGQVCTLTFIFFK